MNPENLHSRTCRFTWAVSNCDGSQVYVPESESWAFLIVSVLIVVPSAICSGGVVWSLRPPIAVNLKILKTSAIIEIAFDLVFWFIGISKTWYSNLYHLPGTLRPNCCSNWNSLCIMPPFHVSWSHQRLRYHAFELNSTRWLNEYIPVSKYSNFWYWNENNKLLHKILHF